MRLQAFSAKMSLDQSSQLFVPEQINSAVKKIMLRHKATALLILLVLCSMFLCATPALATTLVLGPNLGQITYTLTSTHNNTCTYQAPPGHTILVTYSIDTYSNLVYTNTNPSISQGLPGFINLYGSPGPGAGVNSNCPAPTQVNGPLATGGGPGYSIDLYPGLNAIIKVPGYINPKYMVVGVIYAPPGSASHVDYTQSDLVSSTMTTKHSYATSYSQGTTTLGTINFGKLNGWKNGSIDTSSSVSNSYKQTTTTTDVTAATVQKQVSILKTVVGPTCSYCGVDHDYDLIEVWLNPVELFTLTNGGVVISNGYGFSTLDQPGMEVYDVFAGELNGDFAMRGSTTTAFARSWASGESWPSGQGPALSSQDLLNILKTDTYWNCTFKSPTTDAVNCTKPPDPTRFTLSSNVNFPYTQPIPGGSPSPQTLSWGYSITNSQGSGVSYEFSQTFGLESSVGVSLFGIGYQTTLKQSWTSTSTYETSSLLATSSSVLASATITGPPCTVVSGSCNPVYPPAHAFDPITCTPLSLAEAFGQGTSMFIYQDNLFGTFLMEPYGY